MRDPPFTCVQTKTIGNRANRLGSDAASARSRSKPQQLRLDYVRNRADLREQELVQGLVDLNQTDRVRARRGAAQMEGGDVDAGLAESPTEIADETGLVLVAHEQHVRPQLRLHRHVLDH